MVLNKRVGRTIIWILISVQVQISRVGREKILKINKRAALLFGTIEYVSMEQIIKWNIVFCSLVQIYWFCGGLCYCHMKDWIGCVIFLCLRSRCCRIWTAFFFLIIIIIIVIVVFARLHNRWLLTSTEINRGCHSWQGWICNFKVLSFITQKFQ